MTDPDALTPEQLARAAAEKTGQWPDGWGPFHRHFANDAIHRDGGPGCDQAGSPRRVYVFDPDYLDSHERFIAERTQVEERKRIAGLIRKNAATLDSFAREGSTAGLIAYLIDNVMATPEDMGSAVQAEPGRPDQDGRDLGTGRDGHDAPTSPARTSQPTTQVDLLGALQDSVDKARRAVPVVAEARGMQEFCGTLPGHPPHGHCGGYPHSPAAPNGPTCSECGKPRSDDPESEEGMSGMCLRCLLGPLPSEMDSQP